MRLINKLKQKKIKRFFWELMLRTPSFLRKRIIRSRFEINYNMNENIVFKQAQSKKEIDTALSLVYEAYLGLKYIDSNVQNLHFTKYLGLPTTVILVIKIGEEVVGTMSIVQDSALGLPCDTTWNLDEVRKKGKIAEISALCIKKDLKTNKGHLLLPLCKLMHKFCTEILDINVIVLAATHEVEPFYTDLLLFEKIDNITGQKHSLVKGNESTCCYLVLGKSNEDNYYKVYNGKAKSKNLHHFFLIHESSNIEMPNEEEIFTLRTNEKNKNILELFREKPLKLKNG